MITTDRLLIVPISEEFTEEIFHEFTQEITTFMFPRPARDISETKEFVKDSLENMSKNEEFIVAILKKDTREFLGCSGLHRINTSTPELGIWLKKSAHGFGYGREAIGGLIQWANNNLEFEYLTYPVDKRNIPSRKIPESFGGVIADEYKKKNLSGIELDEVEYRIQKLN